jgi:tRNA(Ile)-lysidine synthase
LRGTELAGLAGLKARGPLPGDAELVVVRPLIDWRREEVRELLRSAGRSWCEDSSNADARFTRNRVRHMLLPLLDQHCGPDGIANLRAFADSVESFETRLAHATATLNWDAPTFAAARRGRGDAHVGGSIARADLARLAPALRRRALWRLLTEGAGTAPGSHTLEAALDDLAAGRCSKHALPGGWRLQLRSDKLHLTPPPAQLEHAGRASAAEQLRFAFGAAAVNAVPLSAPGVVELEDGRAITSALCSPTPGAPVPRSCTVVELDASLAGEPLSVRFARPGDRFHALGAPGPRQLGRFLRDAGVPREERGRIPLVFSGSQLVWVAGVRPAEIARVGPLTRERLRLELQGAAEDCEHAPVSGGVGEAGELFQDGPIR